MPHVVTLGHGEVVANINFGNQRTDTDRQIVFGPASVSAPAGASVDFPLQYDTSTGDTTMTGLGLRMHYDSSFLSFDGLTDVLPMNYIAQQGPMYDANDFDDDPNTDKYILVAWSDPLGGNWPNEALPVTLFDAHLRFADGLETGTSTDINFSASSTAAGYEFDGRSITAIVAPPVNLDVDDNCVADALTDGVLMMRYLFGFTGEELVRDAVAPDAGRIDPSDVVEFLDGGRTTMLDPDDNGQADALTDGVLILRYLFGFSGDELVENALAPDARRTDPDDIADFLHGFLPTSSSISRTTTQSPFTDVPMQQLAAPGLVPTTELLPVGEGEAAQNLQIVTSAPHSQVVAAGEQVSIDVSYTTSPQDPTLMGLGLRMHFDSSSLTFDALSNVLGTNFVAEQAPQADTLDYDNDPNTDQFVLVAWSDPFGGNWPGSLPTTLFRATFTSAADLADETVVNFSASSTAAGFDLSATSAQIRVADETPTELAEIRLETTDLDGNPISSVVVGQEFLVSGLVQDLRPQPAGVFAAYVDVTYDADFVAVEEGSTIAYGERFSNVHAGDVSSPGLVDEVGAVAGVETLGGGEFLLFSVRMLPTEEGHVSFGTDPADLLPHHQMLLFGRDEALSASEIAYGTTVIDVFRLVAGDDVASTDEDNVVDVSVLANDVGQNLIMVAFDSESECGAEVTDNGDGTLSYDPRHSSELQSLGFGEVLVDSFTYTISGTNGTTATATVTVTVAGVNDAPAVENPNSDQRIMPTLAFSLTIPEETFVDLENDALSYNASLEDDSALPGWLIFDPQTRTFSGTPIVSDIGTVTIAVTATDNGEPNLSATDVFSIAIYNPYQNPVDPCDVNDDGWVTPIDALIVINELNKNGSRRLPMPPEPPLVPPPYPDVNGDLHVSPIGALLIINRLNASGGEGEASARTINPLAADRIFSEAGIAEDQADAVPFVPTSTRWDDSGVGESWELDPVATTQEPGETDEESPTQLFFGVSPGQVDSAIRLDEGRRSDPIDSLGLEIEFALNDLLPDIAEEIAVR